MGRRGVRFGGVPVVHLVLPRSEANGLHHVWGHRFVPLGLMTIGALARREGWDVVVVDENYESLPDECPDLVGITCWTLFAPRAYAIADRYRAMGVPVVMGGVHVSLLPGEALRHADAVVVGEAESILPSVLSDALAGTLAGMYRGSWEDMSDTPTLDELGPFYDRFPAWRYWPQYSIQSTRGCRFNCDYCSVIRINGRGQRHRDPGVVVDELRRRTRRNRLTAGLFFTDDDFGSDLDYTTELLTAMADAALPVKWIAQTSIGIARNEALLDLARRSGCSSLFLGLESITRESLLEANKKNRPSEYAELVARIHDAGIGVEGAFVFGFDTDGPEAFDDTVDFADEIGVDLGFFSVLTPLPGTGTFSRLWEQGRIFDVDWSHYSLLKTTFEPARMSAAELDDGVLRAFRRFYEPRRRARRLRRHLRQLPPDFAVVLALVGRGIGREYRRNRTGADRAPYVAHPEDLERLAVTSAAPASEAIWLAADQVDGGPGAVTVPVALAPRPSPRATGAGGAGQR